MKGAVKILLAAFSLVYHMLSGFVRGAQHIITAVFNLMGTVKLIFVTKEQTFNAINVMD